jgi:hypothetical protein
LQNRSWHGQETTDGNDDDHIFQWYGSKVFSRHFNILFPISRPLNVCSFAPSFLRHPTFHRYRRQANSAKIEIPSYLHPTWGIRGESCDSVCARFDQRCSVDDFSVINRFGFYWVCRVLILTGVSSQLRSTGTAWPLLVRMQRFVSLSLRFNLCSFFFILVVRYFGSDMPNMDITKQQCLANQKPKEYPFSCSSQHFNTKRMCPCVK